MTPQQLKKRIDVLEAALISIASHVTNIAHHATCIENIVEQQFTKREFTRRINGAKPKSNNLPHVYEKFEELRKRFEVDK
jgi:hypothetical protein